MNKLINELSERLRNETKQKTTEYNHSKSETSHKLALCLLMKLYILALKLYSYILPNHNVWQIVYHV